jgi:hypothetical protein
MIQKKSTAVILARVDRRDTGIYSFDNNRLHP